MLACRDDDDCDRFVPAVRGPGLNRVIGPKLLLFLVIGDMLGTGIYALTGDVAGRVGGAAWLAFGGAFIVAMFTATSYLELCGKYPYAAGAALYSQRAFNSRFVTFLVGFAVMCSALTSVAAASRAFSGYFQELAVVPLVVLVPLFILGLAYINFRGVAESVKLNVVMTCVELAGLLIVILIGAWALSQGIGEPARALEFNAGAEPFSLVVSGAALAFFAIIGFEDSVNMVEETTNPQRDFPRAFFIGITITGIVYMLVAFFTTALVPIEVLRDTDQRLARGRARRRAMVPARGVLVHRDGRRRQHVADQPHDGVAALVRHVERACDSAAVRCRARAAAYPVGGDHLHHGARAAAR